MSDVVVDSCVVTKWLLPEADSQQAQRLFTDVVGRDEGLLVLDLMFVEVANVIWKKRRQDAITLADANQFVSKLLALSVQIHRANALLPSAFEIAAKYDRSVYDALFVALAQELQLPGVTADEKLWQAVKNDFPNIHLLRDWH
jgi:predicted nucleic acid-binding protein